ncbi:hypothetical protein [Acinetobacter junii]|nr:hypothetical protein [Acinetobacter junii]
MQQAIVDFHLDEEILRSDAACILIDIVISYHYTQIVEFGVLLKS